MMCESQMTRLVLCMCAQLACSRCHVPPSSVVLGVQLVSARHSKDSRYMLVHSLGYN
jgi:hypothetical protein